MALAPQCLLQAREILTKAVEISAKKARKMMRRRAGQTEMRGVHCFCGTDLAYASFGSLLLGCDIEGEKESQDYEDEQREEDPRDWPSATAAWKRRARRVEHRPSSARNHPHQGGLSRLCRLPINRTDRAVTYLHPLTSDYPGSAD